MRKLKQVIVLDEFRKLGDVAISIPELLALDENGELWHGTLETTDDERRVIEWTPVNTPKDGAGFSEPQISFFDKWEQDARARLQADTDSSGETVPLETEEQDDARTTVEEAQDSSDDSVEDGERHDPGK